MIHGGPRPLVVVVTYVLRRVGLVGTYYTFAGLRRLLGQRVCSNTQYSHNLREVAHSVRTFRHLSSSTQSYIICSPLGAIEFTYCA